MNFMSPAAMQPGFHKKKSNTIELDQFEISLNTPQ